MPVHFIIPKGRVVYLGVSDSPRIEFHSDWEVVAGERITPTDHFISLPRSGVVGVRSIAVGLWPDRSGSLVALASFRSTNTEARIASLAVLSSRLTKCRFQGCYGR